MSQGRRQGGKDAEMERDEEEGEKMGGGSFVLTCVGVLKLA